MKRMMVIALAAISFAACNSNHENEAVEATDNNVVDNNGEMNTTTAYNPSEGDVMYSNNQVMVWRNGQWVKAEGEVEQENGVVVYQTGRVKKGEHEIVLNDGEIVTKTGNFFDKTGHAISDAWDATKEGAKDAGNAVKDAANEVGNKVGDAFDGKKDKKD